VLFGLPGVRVVRVEQVEFGEREVHVETAEESASGCPSCGVVSRSVKQYVTTAPRDLPLWGSGDLGRVAQASVALCRAELPTAVLH
jgi:hypothetical protein